MSSIPGYITTAEAGKRLGVWPRTIRVWIDEGRLRGKRVSPKQTLVEESSVATLERQRNGRPGYVREWR
jgi:excisionase family DNA binding protein